MKILQGNIWAHLRQGYKVVVTTNIGWGVPYGTRDRRVKNNMGAGLAWQAQKYFPELPVWYGETVRALYSPSAPFVPPVEHPRYPLIFLPVKLMHPSGPHLSWAHEANLELIEAGLVRLAAHHGEIALTMPGCGNGGLHPSQVLPLLERHLQADRFVVVDQQPASRLGPLTPDEGKGLVELLDELEGIPGEPAEPAEASPVLH